MKKLYELVLNGLKVKKMTERVIVVRKIDDYDSIISLVYQL